MLLDYQVGSRYGWSHRGYKLVVEITDIYNPLNPYYINVKDCNSDESYIFSTTISCLYPIEDVIMESY